MGPQSKGKLDFHFDGSKKVAKAQMEDWAAIHDRKVALHAARCTRHAIGSSMTRLVMPAR